MITTYRTKRLIVPVLGLITILTSGLACSQFQRTRLPDEDRPEAVEFYVRGEQLRRQGNLQGAEDEYRAAVQRNPNLRMPHSRLGDMYKQRGDYAKASGHYEAVARLDPYDPQSHYNLGLSYHFLNQLQDAAASYLRALNLNPRDMSSNMNLGLVYLALDQPDDAVKYLQRATEVDPKSAIAWSNLGVALDARGDSRRAEGMYRRSLELNSNATTTLQNLAANLLSQGKPGEAIAVMEQVIERVDTAGTRKRFADTLVSANRFDEAVRQYDIALKRDPRYYPAMNEKAFVLIRQYRDGLELDDEKRKGAIALFRDSLKLNPNQPVIKRQLEKAENPQLFGT